MSLRNQILSRAPKTPTLVPLGMLEWGDVYIKTWTAAERDAYEAQQSERNKAGKGLENFRARFVAACLVDAAGTPVFSDADAAELGNLPLAEVNKAFTKAMKVNGLGDEDEKDLTKNS